MKQNEAIQNLHESLLNNTQGEVVATDQSVWLTNQLQQPPMQYLVNQIDLSASLASVSEAHPKDEILMEECPYALSLLRFLRWCEQLLLITTMHDKSTNVDVGHQGILCLLVKLEVPKSFGDKQQRGERIRYKRIIFQDGFIW